MSPTIRRKLSIVVLLGLLAAVLPARAAQASTVTKCNPGTYGVYVVLFNESGQNPLVFYSQSYNSPPIAPPPSPQEPRRFDELIFDSLEPPSFYAMCSNDVGSFRTTKGVTIGDSIGRLRGRFSELHEVLDDASNEVVGTAWLDQLEPFDQGGAIAGQSYWRCGAASTPRILNHAWFASGLDAGAINHTSDENIELHYMRHIRERALVSVSLRMTSEECTHLLTKADFLAMPNLAAAEVLFINGDPNLGAGDTN